MDAYVPPEARKVRDETPPLDTSVQRLEIDTHLLSVELAVDRLRVAMEKFSRFRNYLRSQDQPFKREELETHLEQYTRAKAQLNEAMK